MGQLVVVEFGGMSKALINRGPRLTAARFIFIAWLREHTSHPKYIRARGLQKRTDIYTGCDAFSQR